NPHRRSDPAAVGRACLKCHPPADCGERGRLPAAVRDDCAGCHMPPRVWMNVHFHTEDDQYVPPIRRHDHRIAVHPDARQAVLLAWHRKQPGPESRLQAERLQAALVKHWLAEAAKREGEYRFLAAIGAYREALRLDTAPAIRDKLRQAVATQARLDADLVAALHQMEQRRYAEAAETLRRALRVKPDWAVAHGKLGTLYAIAGQHDRAAEHLRAVARYDPDDPYGYSMLGWLAYLGDRPEEAVEAYRKADEIEPYDAKINYHMGLALMKLARWPEAAACFRKAAAVDPNHAGAYQGLGTALGRQGRTDEAVRCARRAARLTRFQNPDVLITLAEAYAGAGRTADADRTASQALDAARAGNPELVPQIRQRLREVQSRSNRTAE
ncbi:MAG TPA: tetratricopeptide repeat protein, partial [Gemmataceae bacterium]|nr:tetratricopeptide repeat protein [Gemmataceae bacterium]